MKYLIGFVLLSITMFSCQKVDELTQFEMEFSESFTVQAGTPLDIPMAISTPEIDTEYQAVYDKYDTRADRIEEVILKELELIISSPSNGSFNFLESVELSISSQGNDPQNIAYSMEIPNNGSAQLSLETSDVNLKDFLSVDRFTIIVNTVTDELITTDYTIDVHSVFFVDARVLGQ